MISLSWKPSICQTAALIVGQIVSNSHPTSPILHRPSLICSLPVSPSSFLAFADLEWESSRLFANSPPNSGEGGAANGNLPQKLVTRP